ncbi:MAG: alpha-amylase family glycosyl hydrolase [Candidatus Poribacteria bacterium]|nr:alpha-amylase family glycosyl hydrolase [Candidatus Poribacteria bacterium]MDE0502734.1 alpha-amylase family glycosyl hydrolase [Candidatus Poribacteria bacterium]
MKDENKSQTLDRGTGLIDLDPWLEPFADKLRERFAHYERLRSRIDGEDSDGIMGQISLGHRYLGFNRGEMDGQSGVWYREWAPGADYLALIGEFNDWNRDANPLVRDEHGVWQIFLPDSCYGDRLTHKSTVKVYIGSGDGGLDRIPAFIRRTIQVHGTPIFTGQYWDPPETYKWKNTAPISSRGLCVYEAHVGMAQEDARIGTFQEFSVNILPRIVNLGYNALQLMAVMEHPYYGSFGYHVSNFFAVSSRFGTPEELKELIDTAHGLGILVIMDLVHSHSVKNMEEGLNRFDGTDSQYFHAGKRGRHPTWDSLCFDYAKYEVQQFLLSNVRFWLEEYRFDGFRFDGVTSMLYMDHGSKAFSSYEDYFDGNVDKDALAYLMLANEVAHRVNSRVITIAEDSSGMAGLARPVKEGGLGFDYRLAMGIPDYWIKLLVRQRDEQWNMSEIYHILLNRRVHEKHIGYAESHDQALVGGKTIAFRLMDKEMYWNMSASTPSLVIDRGIALHKMIRLITFTLGGQGYLNFMGNEFGHPEWIDFPRPENDYSHHYARRQWSLVDDKELRYKGLNAFDQEMQSLDLRYNLLEDPLIESLMFHEAKKLLVYRRGDLVFAYNFHPRESYADLRLPVPDPCDYQLALNSDNEVFEGYGVVDEGIIYPNQGVPFHGRNQSIQLYLPARTAQVLAPIRE